MDKNTVNVKMSTPTLLWCYCLNTLKWNAGKVYLPNDAPKLTVKRECLDLRYTVEVYNIIATGTVPFQEPLMVVKVFVQPYKSAYL